MMKRAMLLFSLALILGLAGFAAADYGTWSLLSSDRSNNNT